MQLAPSSTGRREHVIREAYFSAETFTERKRALDLMVRVMEAKQRRARRCRRCYPPGS